MLSITLLILQTVGLLTYPAVLGSIFSGKDIVKYIADMKCDEKDATDKASCEQMKKYKWRVLAVMILYLLSMILFGVAIWFQHKQNKIYNTLILIGSLFSLAGVGVLISIIVGVSKDVSDFGEGSVSKYLWLLNALTLIFSVITVILGMSYSIYGITH